MADIFARMRQLRGTTADWAANDIVLGAGEFGIEVVGPGDIRIKNGDGSTKWSALPYASAPANNINAAIQAALNGKVAKAGDTMTGPLKLPGNATQALEAVPKQQLDVVAAAAATASAGKVSKAGDNMTGPLTLAADPKQPLEAATMQYVDNNTGNKVDRAGDTMTGPLTLPADPTQPLEAATKQYVDAGSHTTAVGGAPQYAGKTVILNAQGVLDSSIAPVHNNYLGALDITKPYALTGTPPGNGDYFVVAKTGTIDPSWVTRIVGNPTTAGEGQFLIHGAGSNYDLVGDTTASAQLAHKLDLGGGTMTGPIVLPGNPTQPLQAAPKQYVDGMLPKAGGTMTGPIVLAAAPAADMQAANKKYVDDMISSTSLHLKISGGTLTGPLILAAAPTVNLGAATKKYVDDVDAKAAAAVLAAVNSITSAYQLADSGLVNRAGDTMTGKLTLAVEPTAPKDAVTKTYADSKAPINSPALTGKPTGPTAPAYQNDTQLATTAQVRATVVTVPEKQVGDYQLVAGDEGKMLWCTGSSIVIPTHATAAIPVNARIDIISAGANPIAFSVAAGVTLLSKDSKRKTAGQWAGATLWKQNVNQWVLIGDLIA